MKIIIEFKCMLTYTLFSMHTIFKEHHNVYYYNIQSQMEYNTHSYTTKQLRWFGSDISLVSKTWSTM